MHNIEKSAFRKGEYVGYGGGIVWHIRKTTSSYGNWIAYTDRPRVDSIRAWRLADLSEKLAALERVD